MKRAGDDKSLFRVLRLLLFIFCRRRLIDFKSKSEIFCQNTFLDLISKAVVPFKTEICVGSTGNFSRRRRTKKEFYFKDDHSSLPSLLGRFFFAFRLCKFDKIYFNFFPISQKKFFIKKNLLIFLESPLDFELSSNPHEIKKNSQRISKD